MKIVSNSTPIISLATIGYIHLLPELFNIINIPKAVYNELKKKEAPGHYEVDKKYFRVQEIQGKKYLGLLLKDLDAGEAESIILAHEINAETLIIDERAGYNTAKSLRINVIGTLSVLLMAKEAGLINKVKPLLEEMIKNGRWYSISVYNNFLSEIGEL